MPRIAPLAALALVAGCAAAPGPAQVSGGPAPYWTAPSPRHSENGQITGSKAVTGRRPSIATTPPGSAYAGMSVAPPSP